MKIFRNSPPSYYTNDDDKQMAGNDTHPLSQAYFLPRAKRTVAARVGNRTVIIVSKFSNFHKLYFMIT